MTEPAVEAIIEQAVQHFGAKVAESVSAHGYRAWALGDATQGFSPDLGILAALSEAGYKIAGPDEVVVPRSFVDAAEKYHDGQIWAAQDLCAWDSPGACPMQIALANLERPQ